MYRNKSLIPTLERSAPVKHGIPIEDFEIPNKVLRHIEKINKERLTKSRRNHKSLKITRSLTPALNRNKSKSTRDVNRNYSFGGRKTKTFRTRFRGGTTESCKPITNPDDVEWMLTQSIDNALSGIKCKVRSSESGCEIHIGKDSIQAEIKSAIQSGVHNAVFNTTEFMDCNSTDHILRISKMSYNTNIEETPPVLNTVFTNTQINLNHIIPSFIQENRYAVMASSSGISPKIYRVGVLADAEKPGYVYFYSIMQKIQGSDLFDDFLEYSGKIYNKDEKVADAAQKDIEERVIKPALEVSNKIGLNGFLMIDNKPENIMMDSNTNKMYIIDFGGFVDFSDDEGFKTMFGRLNRWFFLLNIYKQFHPFITEGPMFNTYLLKMLSSKIKPFIDTTYKHYKDQIDDYYLKNRKGFRDTYDFVGYNVALDLKSIVPIPYDNNNNNKRKGDTIPDDNNNNNNNKKIKRNSPD